MPQSMRSIHICLEPQKTGRLWTETIDGKSERRNYCLTIVTVFFVFGCFLGGLKSNVP